MYMVKFGPAVLNFGCFFSISTFFFWDTLLLLSNYFDFFLFLDQVFWKQNWDFFFDQILRNRDFFSETKFSKTGTEIFFRDQIFQNRDRDFFPRPKSPKTKLKPSKNLQKSPTKKFWNQNINLWAQFAQKKCGAQFATKMRRGPICRRSIFPEPKNDR